MQHLRRLAQGSLVQARIAANVRDRPVEVLDGLG